MKIRKNTRKIGLAVIAGTTTGAALVGQALGASATWTGATNGVWGTGSNWNPAAAPGTIGGATANNTDIATFNNTTNTTISVASQNNLGGLEFATGVGSTNYTFSGSALRLISATIDGATGTVLSTNSTAGITSTITVNNDIRLFSTVNATTNATWLIRAFGATATGAPTITTGNITVDSGVVTGTTGTRTLSLNGNSVAVTNGVASAGIINLNGILSDGVSNNNLLTVRFGTNGGIFKVNGTNTYTGNSSVAAGLVLVGNNSAFGTGTLGLNGGQIAVNGLTARTVNNTWTSVSDSFGSFGSSSAVNSATSYGINNSNAGKLTLSGNGSIGRATSGVKTFSYYTDVELGGVVSLDGTTGGNVTGITINGNVNNTTAVFALTGANTFDRPVTLNNAVVSINTLNSVGAGSGSSLGQPTTAGNGTITFAGANSGTTLRYTGPQVSTNRIVSINSTSQAIIEASGSGTLTFTSNLAYGGTLSNRTLTLSGTNTGLNSFSGTIDNPTGFAGALVKSGSGVWTVSGSNSYTGTTTINEGVLVASVLADASTNSSVGASTSLASNLTIGGTTTATLRYTGAAASSNRLFTIGTAGGKIEASGSGALNLTNIGSIGLSGTNTARTITLGGSNTSANTLAPRIRDNGTGATTLSKVDAGAWTLTGVSNDYSGGTSVTAGTLLVNNASGSATGTGAVTVGNTATFGGAGIVSGAVTVQSGGTLAPGSTVGTLFISGTGSLALNTGSTSNFEITGNANANTYDKVAFSGTGQSMTYGGTLNVSFVGAPTAAGTYTLFDGFGSQSLDFSAVNLPTAPAGFVWHSYGVNDYFDNTTGQIQLDAIVTDAAAVKLSSLGNVLSGTTNRADNNPGNGNPDGTGTGLVTVTGSGTGYVSEIDGLYGPSADKFADGYVQVSSAITQSPTIVMLWLDDGPGSTTVSDLLTYLSANAGGAYQVLDSNSVEWQQLSAHYAGFNGLIQFASGMATTDAFSWKFEGAYADVTVDRIAVVPEPMGLSAATGFAVLVGLGRRRRRA